MGAAESNYLLRLSVPLGILAGLRRIVWQGLERVARALRTADLAACKTLGIPVAIASRRSQTNRSQDASLLHTALRTTCFCHSAPR